MSSITDISRRSFLKGGAAATAMAATSRWSPARAQDANVLNYLSWPGNADPYLVSAF